RMALVNETRTDMVNEALTAFRLVPCAISVLIRRPRDDAPHPERSCVRMRKPKPLRTTRETSEPASIASALRTLEAEAGGITALATAIHDGLGRSFTAAVELIRRARGRLIVTGMGKSGHVARKIAATFASTGTPAFFVHPSEASHGDLG